ncbi:hypothetical protein KJ608_03000 [Patescibacteria group bacterium]|nr:hypothetical protein [Patescibacteria group bacterium]
MLTLQRRQTKYLLASILLLLLLASAYFWRQRQQAQIPTAKLPSPFTDLNYKTANLGDKKFTIAQGSTKQPTTANTYSKTPFSSPSLSDSEGINKLKETLGIKETDRVMAPAEGIFWYARDRYLSYNQETYDLSFTLDINAQERLPQKGGCPTTQEAQNFSRQFLINNKLINAKEISDSQFAISLEEKTAFGLVPAETETCQIVKVNYYPLLDNSPLLYHNTTSIRIMKIDNKNQLAGFYVHNASYQEKQSGIPLKDTKEIKSALSNNEGIYLNTCAQTDPANITKLSTPQLVYFDNNNLDVVQPVFQLKQQVGDSCEQVILVGGLKEGHYQSPLPAE